MRPMARGPLQHGGPPDKSDFVHDGRAVPPAFSVRYRLPWQELPTCKLMEFPAAVIY